MTERSGGGQTVAATQGEETQIVHTDGDSVATDVAVAIANAKGTDPVEIEPLGDILDCQALEDLVTSSSTELSVSFSYDDLEIHVTTEGYVEIATPEAPIDAD